MGVAALRGAARGPAPRTSLMGRGEEVRAWWDQVRGRSTRDLKIISYFCYLKS